VIEYQIRRDFADGVLRGKARLNLDNPLISPITNLIENDVIEVSGDLCYRIGRENLIHSHCRHTVELIH
jgi:hypothetical protein